MSVQLQLPNTIQRIQNANSNPNRLLPATSNRPDQLEVLFSGNRKPSMAHRIGRGVTGVFLSAMALVGVAAPVLASAKPAAAQTVVQGDQVTIDEEALPFVDNASQLPALNSDLTDVVVDLANNPLLSSTTQAELEQFIDELNATDLTQVSVVVINDTHRNTLRELGLEIFNQVGVGHDNDDDGILLIVNANAVRENRSTGRMSIIQGDAWNGRISDSASTDLLRQYAVPHLNAGNYDKAVSETVKAIKAQLEAVQNSSKPNTLADTNQGSDSNNNALIWTLVGLGALIILGLIIAAAVKASRSSGYGDAGYSGGSSSGGGYRDPVDYTPPTSSYPSSRRKSSGSRSSGGGYSPGSSSSSSSDWGSSSSSSSDWGSSSSSGSYDSGGGGYDGGSSSGGGGDV